MNLCTESKIFTTGEFNNDPFADDDHLWGFNGYTSNRLDDQFFLGKDILVAPIVNPGLRDHVYFRHLSTLRRCLGPQSGEISADTGSSVGRHVRWYIGRHLVVYCVLLTVSSAEIGR